MDDPASRRRIGRGRWSARWLEALADLPGAVPGQLIRGRALAQAGRVCDLHVEPGVISAHIQDERPLPYPAAVTVPVLDAAAWERVSHALAAQAAHLAALLAGGVPAAIGAEPVLPGPGQLRTVCTCEDRDQQPCRHTAALCYQAAIAFDEDPFVLLLLRGRTKSQVLTALRENRKPTGSMPTAPGRLARDAYRTVPGPLPHADQPPRPPDSDILVPSLPEPPAASGLKRAELTELADRAARRARELLTVQSHVRSPEPPERTGPISPRQTHTGDDR